MEGDAGKLGADAGLMPAHAHCPHGCEHPQPFFDDKFGGLLCGCCWFKYGICSPMIPCDGDTCEA
jgi:hypothetical protein